MNRTPCLPLPPVPTSSMPVDDRRVLADAVQALKPFLHRTDAQEHLGQAYARVWIHLAMERGLDPRRITSPKSAGFQILLPIFQAAIQRLGLHDRVDAARWAPTVAPVSATLWRQAKEAQGQPVPGLFPTPFSTLDQAQPPRLRSL